MQSEYSDYNSMNTEGIFDLTPACVDEELDSPAVDKLDPVRFHGYFEDCMELYADAQTVANYLDAHHGWFRRCAHPMQAEPLGKNGYALTIGRFGSFGYQVEPKIGLELLPAEERVYRIRTIEVPGYTPPGYEVDFNATQWLVEADASDIDAELAAVLGSNTKMTRVEWQLDLVVNIRFPKFIYRLPMSLIQSTGDRVLAQIVCQVNRRLTKKVQQDFHSSLGIAIPPKTKRRAA